MIDISDGLASEIWHLCSASKTGALVYANRIPIDYQTQCTAEAFGLGGLGFALHGGEDYELLFTLPLSAYERIQGLSELHVIGHLTEAERGIHLAQADGSIVPLEPLGHDHFRRVDSDPQSIKPE
jgi:thiamine-monophosphate kinase